LGASDFLVVPNAVKDFAIASEETELGPANPTVLFVGRLEWRKGPDLLVRAIPSVLRQFPNVIFRFAGLDTQTGPGNSSMRSYLEGLILPEFHANIEFCGHLGPLQLEKVFRSAALCVFPSRYEGLPMVCLEAMARGKAIITTDLPGFCELISDGENGVIAKAEDPEDLASALIKLIPAEQLRRRLGSSAQSTVRTHFNSTAVAESMLEVYRNSMFETKPSSFAAKGASSTK
jgi:glycosyltransferase involved in cell wall biosynthesis